MKKQKQIQLPPLTREEAIASKQQAVIGAKEFVLRAEAERKRARIAPNNLVKIARKMLRDRERELRKLEASN